MSTRIRTLIQRPWAGGLALLAGLALAASLLAASQLNIKAVKVLEKGGRLVLQADMDGAPKVKVSASPNKWLVEVLNAKLASQAILAVGKGKVERIRPGQHGQDAWLVVDLKSAQKARKPVATAKGFTLDLGPAGPAKPVDKAQAQAKAEPSVAQAAKPAAEKPEAAALAPASAGLTYRVVDVALQDQDEEHSQVVITTDGPVKYKVSQQQDGRKVVLAILNGSLAWAGAQLSDSAVSAVQARAVNREGLPQVLVEVDLRQASPFTINRDQNQLVVSVEKPQPDPAEAAESKRGDLNTLISLDVQSADLVGTINSICNQAGFETFQGPSMLALAPPANLVTVRVEKLPLARILGNLLGPIDMNYDLQGNILYFGKAAEIVKQKTLLPKVTKYYTPHTLDRATFNTKLQAELAAVDPMLAGSTQIMMDPDASTEGLMFAATKEDMTKLMAIVYRLDGGESSAEDADEGGGTRKTQVFRLRYTQPSDLSAAITSIITTPDGTLQGVVQQDNRTRSFIITARPKWLKKVRQLLDRLDVQLQQVSIETKVVEVDADSDNELGINWTAKSSQATADPNINASVLAPVNSVGTLMVSTLQNNLNINATLQAMVQEDKASVLSSPRITTQDNQAATITTSDTYTYQTTNTTIGSTTQTTVTYNQISVPITLGVTPLINQENNDIRMTVNFNVSSVVGTPASGVPPNLSIQTANTMVQVKNGETAVIGGLMRDKLTTTDTKVPVLGDIPLLGYFFKSKVVQKSKKELVIFLTPSISAD